MHRDVCEQMVMKDGSIRTFEVSMEQFNQLRYSVAKVRLPLSSCKETDRSLISFCFLCWRHNLLISLNIPLSSVSGAA
jgi:hypothetical protein